MRMLLAGTISLGLAAMLAVALFDIAERPVNLPAQLEQHIDDAGVTHPITAVLLNFRAYDTLLEIGVLLVAILVGMSLRPTSQGRLPARGIAEPSLLLPALARLLAPLMLLTGFYLLWAGSYYPGGAFQAGALIAATGLLLRLAGVTAQPVPDSLWLRLPLAAGFLTFLLAGAAMLFTGRPFLTWPQDSAGSLIFAIELVLTVSIAATLLGLFLTTPSPRSRPGEDA